MPVNPLISLNPDQQRALGMLLDRVTPDALRTYLRNLREGWGLFRFPSSDDPGDPEIQRNMQQLNELDQRAIDERYRRFVPPDQIPDTNRMPMPDYGNPDPGMPRMDPYRRRGRGGDA